MKIFLKRFLVILMIVGISLTNGPYYFVSFAIKAYLKSENIVDQAWHLKQDKNIVDKFTSFRNIAEGLKIQEAKAAITYQTPGALAYSATSIAVPYPASIAANNLLILIVGQKPTTANGGTVTTPSGWTLITSLTGAGGYGTTLGADTGNTNVFAYYKVAVGGETGTLAVTVGTTSVAWGQMYRLSGAAGSTWNVAAATGSDITAGSVSVAFNSNPGVTANDLIIGALVIPTDVTTPAQFSAEALTQAGITFGTVTEISEPDSTTGNDIGGVTFRAPVSSGTATGNPTFTATAGGTTTNVRGPAVFIRIREILAPNTAPTLTVNQPDGTGDTIAQDASYTINYDLADAEQTVTAAFYYDTDATGLNGTAITGACATAAEGTGATCSWNTTGVAPGTYYVYGITNDGIAGAVNDYSPGVVTINARPTLTVTQPDGTGDTVTVGDLYNVTYNLADTDDAVTAAFYYDTDATGLNGTAITGACATAAEGTGATCSWDTTGVTPGTYYVYGITNDGVNTQVNDYTSGVITINAPNTPPTLTVSQPDGVTDTVNAGDAYNITYDLADVDNVVTAAFYYDTDATGLNGTAISGACATAAEGTGATCSWDTTGITAGSYYVYGIVNDGVNPQVSAYSSGMITINTPTTLTVSATAGSKVANLNSGDTSQYIHATSCTSETDCAAIKLSATNGSVIVTSIKVTESGTVAANTDLSNAALIYDTDANYANGTAGTFGSTASFAADQTITFSNAGVTINAGSSYYFYIRFDVKSATPTYPVGGQTINFGVAVATDIGTSGTPVKSGTASLVGTTTVRPQITGYTNSTESGLNYAASCTGCGARIGPAVSGRSQTLAVSGYGFGSDPGLGSRDTATNKVEVVGASTHVFSDGGSGNTNVTAWSNTSITLTTDSGVTGDSDTGWGTDFGGSAALKVTAGGQAVPTNLNFYIFPQVTSITVCNSATFPVGDNAREYSAGDVACPNGLKDGEIILNGTRFGTASTGGYVRILGCDSATCSGPTGSVVTTAWSNTAITAQVPTVISDSVYTGSVVMQQGTGSNNKTHTYTASGFRVLPRITNVAPASAANGDPVTISGDHLCQTGTCPVAFSASNKVTFYNAVDAVVFTSWAHASLATEVPGSAQTGNIFITSNNYPSNDFSFTVLSPVPMDPTSLNQYSNSALTNAISVGAGVSTTPIYFGFIMEAPAAGGTLYSQVEVKPVGTPFVCASGACASALEGAGKTGPGPVDCTSAASNCFVTSSPSDDIYHWQARVRHNKGGTDYYSNWISFGGNSEAATDFQVDSFGPTITFPNGDSCSGSYGTSVTTNGATISWSLNEGATGQVEYSIASNLSGSLFSPVPARPSATSHVVTLSNLDSNTTYYFRVKSVDSSGNISYRPSAGPYCSFLTGSVSQPAKTTIHYISSFTSSVSSFTSSSFVVDIPETSADIKSAFVEITGISPGAGTNNITVGVNAEATKTYAVASGDSSFKIIYPVTTLNLDPSTNELDITPSQAINIISAKIIVTYAYTP